MKYRWDKKYLHWGVTAFCVVAACIIFYMMLTRWDDISQNLGKIFKVFSPFIVGLILAYLLTPVLNFLEKKILNQLGRKIFVKNRKAAHAFSRGAGILISLSLFFFLVSMLIFLIITELYKNSSNIEDLFASIPMQFNNLIAWIEAQFESYPEIEQTATALIGNISDFVSDWTQTSLLPSVNQFLSGVTSGVYLFFQAVLNLFISVIVSIYVMYNKEMLSAQVKKFLYGMFDRKQTDAILEGTGYVNRAFGGFFSGKILDSFIIGIICFVGVYFLRMPSPALIAIIIGITNIIPFFGPFIGAIPCALLVLLDSPGKCIVFLIFILALQQFDGNILGPKILGGTTGLPGLWVIVAIVVGGGFFGFIGMLCGVPVCAVLYGAVRRFTAARLKKKDMPVDTEFYKQKDFSLNKK